MTFYMALGIPTQPPLGEPLQQCQPVRAAAGLELLAKGRAQPRHGRDLLLVPALEPRLTHNAPGDADGRPARLVVADAARVAQCRRNW
jgi:hypothetical protein